MMGWSDVRHHYEEYEDSAPDWKTLSSTKHTARTQKTCEHCKWLIEPGQRYHKLVALNDGEFTLIYSHEDKDICRAGYAKVEEAEAEMIKAWDTAIREEMEGLSNG